MDNHFDNMRAIFNDLLGNVKKYMDSNAETYDKNIFIPLWQETGKDYYQTLLATIARLQSHSKVLANTDILDNRISMQMIEGQVKTIINAIGRYGAHNTEDSPLCDQLMAELNDALYNTRKQIPGMDPPNPFNTNNTK